MPCRMSWELLDGGARVWIGGRPWPDAPRPTGVREDVFPDVRRVLPAQEDTEGGADLLCCLDARACLPSWASSESHAPLESVNETMQRRRTPLVLDGTKLLMCTRA
jgi:hypothetical protein